MKYKSLIFIFSTAVILSACGGNSSNVDVISATTLDCPSGSVITGVTVRLGNIIDNLALRCAPINQGYPDNTTDGNNVGGTGGTLQAAFTCPVGSAVTTISGFNGLIANPNNLGAVRVTCSDTNHTQSPNYYSNSSPGKTAYTYTCPAGQVASSLRMNVVTNGSLRYAGYIDSVVCAVLPPV